ncbi:MAG: hypothetical protein HUU35_10055, partial [Armatimonadetes bacterium]|nr:hypothetical protein [Armatimonadota bacterium]
MTLTAGPLRYILFGTICAGTFAVGVAGALFHEDHRITEGVYVEQVHVGGLSSAEATAKLERELLPAMPRQLELRSGASRWLVDNEKLGRRAKLKETVAQAY